MPTERDTIATDARHVFGMPTAERAAVFIGLEQTLEAVLAHLPSAERIRRRDAARLLDPLPAPWWTNLRRSCWPSDDVFT